MLPPKISGLSAYNIGNQLTGAAISGITTGLVINGNTQAAVPPGIHTLSPEDAYGAFIRNLTSLTVRQQFFKQFYLPAHSAQNANVNSERLWQQLNKELTITVPSKPTDHQTSVTIVGKDSKQVADWTNAYVALAIKAAQQSLMDDLAEEIQIRSKSITEQITTVRKIALVTRESRITQLRDAIKIAESLGRETSPSVNSNLVDISRLTDPSSMSLIGTKALRAELNILSQRNDPYIPELPDLLKKQSLLKSIPLNPAYLSVAVIDRAASPSEDPIKPRKALILALGLVLGAMLGILIALICKKIQKQLMKV